MAKGRGCAGCRGRQADLEESDLGARGLRAELDAMHARADAADLVAGLTLAALILITWHVFRRPVPDG